MATPPLERSERLETVSAPQPVHGTFRAAMVPFAICSCVLLVVFAGPLLNWARFALSKERNSYLLLVPIVSAYLIRTRRQDLRDSPRRSVAPALLASGIGIAALAAQGMALDPLDRLSLQIFALLSFLLSGAFIFWGAQILRRITFPIAFLLFAVPVPATVAEHIEIFLQYTSAEAAYWLMSLAGIPMIREGINFRLPNIYIQVAQECSGYNSSFSLFMVSTVAGYLFLNSPSRRIILSLAVIPLAIVRNGFRVTTLASLCVYDDPKWIDSTLHHKGGPLFFALSLIPFFLLLWALRRSDTARNRTP